MSGLIKTLVDTCANSAAKVIDLLTVRLENNMIGKLATLSGIACADVDHSEVFLPFQLETLSSALIVLLVIRAVCPTCHNVSLLEERAQAIFDEMIVQKNPIAKYRKTEAIQVQELLASLNDDTQSAMGGEVATRTNTALSMSTPTSYGPCSIESLNDSAPLNNSSDSGAQISSGAIPAFPMEPDDEFLSNFGLSFEAIDCVANQVLFDVPLDSLAYWAFSEHT